jgi:microcystin-dependent protein
MSQPYIGEIRAAAFGIAPRGWAPCNGQILSIQQNQALFAILGTTYGGDGVQNFALPNLQGRSPVYNGNGISLGESAGEATHTLISTEMPTHNHPTLASAIDGTSDSTNKGLGAAKIYGAAGTTPTAALDPSAVGGAGGSQPHENMQPYLVINYIIALQGIFPSRS